MSPSQVEWETAAEDELARFWLRSSDPQAITAAQAKADQLLARDPVKHGRHLSEGLYCPDVPPLAVIYAIDSAKRCVQVTWVHTT